MKALVSIVLLACAVYGQSLGEVARQNRQQRSTKVSAKKRVTDENLVRKGGSSTEATLQRLYREFKETVPQPATDHAHVFWSNVLNPENRAVPEDWERVYREAVAVVTRGCAANPQFTLPDKNQKAMEDVYNAHSDRLRDLGKRYQQMLAENASQAEMKKIEYDFIASDIQTWQMFYEWTWVKVDCQTFADRGKKDLIN
ncbi:MAG: hypothetical protein L0Z53_09120 [Acidobacteriales bacterium]|nr:hypothetical protein [Terriglobales bacterium]